MIFWSKMLHWIELGSISGNTVCPASFMGMFCLAIQTICSLAPPLAWHGLLCTASRYYGVLMLLMHLWSLHCVELVELIQLIVYTNCTTFHKHVLILIILVDACACVFDYVCVHLHFTPAHIIVHVQIFSTCCHPQAFPMEKVRSFYSVQSSLVPLPNILLFWVDTTNSLH